MAALVAACGNSASTLRAGEANITRTMQHNTRQTTYFVGRAHRYLFIEHVLLLQPKFCYKRLRIVTTLDVHVPSQIDSSIVG